MEIKTKQQGIKVVADVLEIVGGKWRGPILSYLCDKPRRFNELKQILAKITSSTLTKELRYLEELKMIERIIIQESPQIIEYRMSPHGKSIKSLIEHIVNWGLEHRKIVFEG
ncbi:MAG: transcriptional regulator [Bacteroidetes bacterium B1(2017)]|nr:MAG: transcriptional regulator [Bacteroidetes bacterium B1(2017)]